MESARRAQLIDGERVAALRSEVANALRGARGGQLLMADRTSSLVPWSTWVEDPARLAVLGTLEEHVVGYGLARLQDFPDGSRLGVIEELWVEAEARGVGVGEALMGLITEWCVWSDCSGVDAVALPGDRIMKGFFEGHGLKARLLIMHRDLPGREAKA